MDRLASCYFCGDAFDASLSEYPVVPKELRPPEDGPTVVLCGDCRRKLGAVVEEVVAATEGASAADDAAADGRNERADAALANGAESADSPRGSPLDDGTDDEPTTDADEWESPTRDGADEEASTAGPDADATGTPSDGATEDDDGSDAETTDGSEPTLTKLEYNKVMRLLKNRAFPVDRTEIREVATSAYDIDPAEFDAVIEAAVSRDLIAVEDGQFVDPE
ncbi:hypothetical protein [Haloarcula laminariae]|uniref:hypothetical protein n=1 Tax=Haloarcula laminariae TaxID=2961577 RepID=UPI0021CA5512|nr:hypothetical protein [Halomicroarcula laminariae]